MGCPWIIGSTPSIASSTLSDVVVKIGGFKVVQDDDQIKGKYFLEIHEPENVEQDRFPSESVEIYIGEYVALNEIIFSRTVKTWSGVAFEAEIREDKLWRDDEIAYVTKMLSEEGAIELTDGSDDEKLAVIYLSVEITKRTVVDAGFSPSNLEKSIPLHASNTEWKATSELSLTGSWMESDYDDSNWQVAHSGESINDLHEPTRIGYRKATEWDLD